MTRGTLLRLIRALAKAGQIVGFGLLEYSGSESDADDPFLEKLIAFGQECLIDDTEKTRWTD